MESATLNGLMELTETALPLPESAQKLLHRETIKVRIIDRGTLGCFFPMAPEQVVDEPEKDLSDEAKSERFEKRLREWLRTAPEDVRIAHRLATERVKFHVISQVALEPKLTVDQASRLGSAADEIYLGILRFSGLAKPVEVATE